MNLSLFFTIMQPFSISQLTLRLEFKQTVFFLKTLAYIFLSGLCGTLDNNPLNDYVMQGGTLYKGRELRPTKFSLSWL